MEVNLYHKIKRTGYGRTEEQPKQAEQPKQTE